MNKLSSPILAGMLAGCSLAPEYQRPPSPVPEQFPDASAAVQGDLLSDGRVVFRDPRVQRLIELGSHPTVIFTGCHPEY